MAATSDAIPETTIRVLDHGFVRLDGAMASDLSVVNGARVSFARRKEVMEESDEGLIRFLMRDRHGTPFEHNAFRFHIRCPIFVAREWMRHRVGCLTGDTVVTFVDVNGRSSSQCRRTIDELWQLWTRGERNGHALKADQQGEAERLAAEGKSVRSIARELGVGRRSVAAHLQGRNEYRAARRRVRRMRLRVLNEVSNEFETGHISDIVDKGIQPVYRLTLADGRSLTATENHRLLTQAGWASMREAVGLTGSGESAVMTRACELITNGSVARRDREWLRPRREVGKSPHASTARWGREQAPRVHSRFDYACQLCGRRGGQLHAHHAIPVRPDRRDRDPENLVSVCAPCHSVIHRSRDSELVYAEQLAGKLEVALPLGEVPDRAGWKLTGHAVAVERIDYVGLRQTYDLCVEGPSHNFVANGIVVHNSFNEFSMRYAKATDDFYVPEPDDVRTQVGKPGAYTFEPVDPEIAEQTRDELRAVYDAAFAAYERLVGLGVARELARCVMPVGGYTEFYWTINARSLMNFVSLRAAETAQREIRRYAEAIEQFFAEKMPVTHAAFVANDRVAP